MEGICGEKGEENESWHRARSWGYAEEDADEASHLGNQHGMQAEKTIYIGSKRYRPTWTRLRPKPQSSCSTKSSGSRQSASIKAPTALAVYPCFERSQREGSSVTESSASTGLAVITHPEQAQSQGFGEKASGTLAVYIGPKRSRASFHKQPLQKTSTSCGLQAVKDAMPKQAKRVWINRAWQAAVQSECAAELAVQETQAEDPQASCIQPTMHYGWRWGEPEPKFMARRPLRSQSCGPAVERKQVSGVGDRSSSLAGIIRKIGLPAPPRCEAWDWPLSREQSVMFMQALEKQLAAA